VTAVPHSRMGLWLVEAMQYNARYCVQVLTQHCSGPPGLGNKHVCVLMLHVGCKVLIPTFHQSCSCSSMAALERDNQPCTTLDPIPMMGTSRCHSRRLT
jgi:hypothetical protein